MRRRVKIRDLYSDDCNYSNLARSQKTVEKENYRGKSEVQPAVLSPSSQQDDSDDCVQSSGPQLALFWQCGNSNKVQQVSQCDPLMKKYRSFLDELENKHNKKIDSKNQNVETRDGIHDGDYFVKVSGHTLEILCFEVSTFYLSTQCCS
jgi:hypothetical protein